MIRSFPSKIRFCNLKKRFDRGNFKSIWRNDLKKLFEEIISGAFEAAARRANSAENAPEGDTEEYFKAIVKTFEIASDNISRKIKKASRHKCPLFFPADEMRTV